ncbi:PREDICTED: transcription factor IBH1-like [Ipomoea nil]|uniref:transcription factor IBH1-like n=1 Tax=Ipomoea nil TaxID=35883 RepID=UPI0009013881|nr:PREDICTED: transcription factor IBH1-like [Ipomoea nil]
MASPNRQWNRCSIQTRFTHRFLRALRRLRLAATRRQTPTALTSPAAPPPDDKEMTTYYRRCRNVKRAAYASMASAVGTRRAWSRAQLLRFRRPAVRRRVAVAGGGGGNHRDETTEELRQLVPGGEVMDLGSLLDETAHYIACLASQVQIMRSIADLFST